MNDALAQVGKRLLSVRKVAANLGFGKLIQWFLEQRRDWVRRHDRRGPRRRNRRLPVNGRTPARGNRQRRNGGKEKWKTSFQSRMTRQRSTDLPPLQDRELEYARYSHFDGRGTNQQLARSVG